MIVDNRCPLLILALTLALREIIRLYPEDPETFTLLKKYIISHGTGAADIVKHYRDRQHYPAVSGACRVGEHYREDPETLPMLKELIQSHDNEFVRGAALSSLAKNYPEDLEILPILKNALSAASPESATRTTQETRT